MDRARGDRAGCPAARSERCRPLHHAGRLALRRCRGAARARAAGRQRDEPRAAPVFRYDRNGDRIVTRNELLATRTAGFRKLDTDGNNLLTFEEWAVTTGNRFKGADRDGNLQLTAEEFRSTAPKPVAKAECRC